MTFGSPVEQKKVKKTLKNILEHFHLKFPVYKMVIAPSQEIALHRLRKIIRNSTFDNKKYNDQKILFNTVVGKYMGITYIEGAIAKSLQIRGNNVKILTCGGGLNMCTAYHRIDLPPNPWSCKNCINFSKKFYDITGLPFSTYKEYIKDEELDVIKNKVNEMTLNECKNLFYKDVEVGSHAITSVQRYFKGEKTSKESYEHILRLELINSIISTEVAEKVLKKEKPDVLVTSHGCYSSWGSITEYFRNKDVRVCVWGSGENNTLTFDMHKSNEYFKKYFEEIRKKRLLNKEEEKELNDFLEKRIKGDEGQVSLYGFSESKKGELEKYFMFDKYDKTYVMFPNVPWDAAVLSADSAFKDIYDWIFYSIEAFKHKPNFQLIIKIHPSEIKVMESKRTVLDNINDKFITLPNNIKIIPPTTKMSPYSLFPFIDVGIVYNGTVGLEMSIQNIPVVAAGNAHYGKKGFTYDVSAKEGYLDVLFGVISPLPNQRNLAKAYAYFHFIKKFIPRRFVYRNNFLDLGWNINSLEDLGPGKDKYLDHVCNYIVNDGVFQDW